MLGDEYILNALLLFTVESVESVIDAKLTDGRKRYSAVHDEMNDIVRMFNQIQRKFMQSYKEVHEIINSMPEAFDDADLNDEDDLDDEGDDDLRAISTGFSLDDLDEEADELDLDDDSDEAAGADAKKSGDAEITGYVRSGGQLIPTGSYTIHVVTPELNRKQYLSFNTEGYVDGNEHVVNEILSPSVWKSSNPSVASVSENSGMISVNSAKGKAKITAFYGLGKNAAKYKFTLRIRPSAVSANLY